MPIDMEGLTLPFAPRKQAAVFWYLLTNRSFFDRAKNKLKPQWFTDHISGKLYGALLKFANDPNHPRLPSKEEFLESRGFMEEEQAVRSAMRAGVETAYNESKVYGLDVLRGELTEWLQAYIYTEGQASSNMYYKQQQFSKAYGIMAERMKLIQDAKFEDDLEFDFSNLEEGIAQSEQRVAEGCSFGLKMMDDSLTPGGATISGGLFRRATTCLMSPINIGKSITMLNVVAANVVAGRRVLLFIHEGEPSDIRDKLLMSMLRVSKPELWAMRTTAQGRAALGLMEKFLKSGLTFIPYIKAGMTVEGVIPIIRQKCEEAKNEGRPYDLLADDYPALLLSEYAKSARMEDRARIEMVYLNFTQLASEFNLHCLVNIQVNRDGSRANKSEDRLLQIEDVSECWLAMAKVDNVITINRSPSDMKKNRLTFLIVKSRDAGTGRAIVCRTDFTRAISHSDRDGFGAVWYFASKMIPSEELDRYMGEFYGGEISEERQREMAAANAAAQAEAKARAKADAKAAATKDTNKKE